MAHKYSGSLTLFNNTVYINFSFFLQTAFVRQKTPHPKELKAKAHKLFGNKKPIDESKQENEQNGEPTIAATNINNLQSEPVSQSSRAFFTENEPIVHEAVNNFSGEDAEEDEEEVSDFLFYNPEGKLSHPGRESFPFLGGKISVPERESFPSLEGKVVLDIIM